MRNFIPTIALLTAGCTGVCQASELPEKGHHSLEESVHLKSIKLPSPDDKKLVNILSLDWDALSILVKKDTQMSQSAKTSFMMIQDISDPVERDKAMKKAPYYKYLYENLYPRATMINIATEK